MRRPHIILLLALMGAAFAGTIVNVGDTVPIGGTTTTHTEDAPPQPTGTEDAGGSAGLGGITMENAEGDKINVGGAKGSITPLGEGSSSGVENGAGESASGASQETAQQDSGEQATSGGSHSAGGSASAGTQVSICEPAFILAALGLAAFICRRRA